jgi:hypothetical protein
MNAVIAVLTHELQILLLPIDLSAQRFSERTVITRRTRWAKYVAHM